jgi:hypothetical protein
MYITRVEGRKEKNVLERDENGVTLSATYHRRVFYHFPFVSSLSLFRLGSFTAYCGTIGKE